MNDGDSELVVPGRVADISGPGGALIDTRCSEPEKVTASEAESIFPERAVEPPPVEVALIKKSDLLAGLKVLDLCNVVAGPNAAYTLAQFGADVIRAEPPKSFNLPMHLEWTLEVNQGKRSMIVDITTEPGREVLKRLVRWADVVLHNRLDPVAERLGLTHAQLTAINSKVVVAQTSAYGGTHRSSWDRIPGYDPMPNLATGLDALAGSPDAPRAMSEIFADLMSGLGTGFAALLGVLQQRRTGHAGEGRSSLARAANFYQLPYMIADAGGSDWGQGSGPEAHGDCWWQRMYECRDQWVYVGASSEHRARLSTVICGRTEAAEADLEAGFAQRDASDWIEALRAEGIACHSVLSIDDLCATNRLRSVDNASRDEVANGPLDVLVWPDHPSGLPVVLPAPAWAQVGEAHSYRRLSPAPRVGAHTRELLAELGYSREAVDKLFALGVAHDYLPAIGDAERYFHQQEKAEHQ
jgi:crotonobetainyl-CoA:carnitine CoA-transferase CaiB-like acyl-CoA transferase